MKKIRGVIGFAITATALLTAFTGCNAKSSKKSEKDVIRVSGSFRGEE